MTLKAAGHTVRTRSPTMRSTPPRRRGQAPQGSPWHRLVHIVRLRYADDEPVSILDNLLPADIAPSMRDWRTIPYMTYSVS